MNNHDFTSHTIANGNHSYVVLRILLEAKDAKAPLSCIFRLPISSNWPGDLKSEVSVFKAVRRETPAQMDAGIRWGMLYFRFCRFFYV